VSLNHHDVHTRRILAQLQARDSISQRTLSRELGIALGLTNSLLRRMIRNGWVEVVRQGPNRLRYVITEAGVTQEALMARDYLREAVRQYRETRDCILESLLALSRSWPCRDGDAQREKRIVFYGTGEVAEIAFITLQNVDLHLVGVVADQPPGTFFGLSVDPIDRLTPTQVAGRPFDRLIVTSFDKARTMPPALASRQFPPERLWWL